MKVIAYDKFPLSDSGIDYVSLDALFAESDIISLHCPLTEETYHLINDSAIELVQNGKYKEGIKLDDNGNLNPKAIVTREDAIVMIAKLFNLRHTGNSMNVLAKFSDSYKVKEENLAYVAAMVKEGYVSGNNGKLNPEKNITRAELVSLLDSTIAVIKTSGRLSDKEIKVLKNKICDFVTHLI